MSQRLSRVGERAKLALLAVLSPLACLAVVECGALVAGVEPVADDPDHRRLALRRECRVSRAPVATVCAPEPSATRRTRVVALGGSSVEGYPIGETVPFPSQLQARLDAAHPRRFEVVNAGLACKDSIFVRECAARALEATPDYLVVYAGHNDFANWGYANPRLQIFLAENAWLYDLQETLLESRAVSLLRRAWQSLDPPGPPRDAAGRSDAQREAARRVVVDHFTANLTEVIERAEATGTEVILVTVVSNLHEYPVRRGRWRRWLEQTRADESPLPWATSFAAGVEHFGAERFEAALAAFKEARERYGGRAPAVLNERIRELGERFAHVHVVDFEPTLDALGLREGIGCGFFGSETYCDQMHPNSRTNRLIAGAVLRKLVELRGDEG